MKNYFFLFIGLFLLNSCDELEEVGPLMETTLNGRWELQSVSCFCFFEDDYDFTTTSLVINTTEVTATFEHAEDTFILDSGIYSFTINNDQISFGEDRWYIFSIEDSTLTLTFVDNPNLADDEISYTFMRQ